MGRARRAWLGAALAVLAAACAPEKDVVARLASSDAGQSGDAPEKEPGVPPGGKTDPNGVDRAGCGDVGPLVALSKTGGIYTFRLYGGVKVVPLEQGAATDGDQPCFPAGVHGAARDRAGLLWVPYPGGAMVVEPQKYQCKAVPLKLEVPGPVTFLYDPSRKLETLYAVIDGVLVTVDTASFARAPIGKIDVPGLVNLSGTPDGRLLAFADSGGPLVTIGALGLGDGALTASWSVKRPSAEALVGGVAWGDAMFLAFGTTLYRYDAKVGTTTEVADLGDAPGLVAVVTSTCPPSEE